VVQQPIQTGDAARVVGAKHGKERASVVRAKRSSEAAAGVIADSIIVEPAVSESVFIIVIGVQVVRLDEINEEVNVESGESLTSKQCFDCG